MKKSTLLKLALVFTAMLMFSGAFAQTNVSVLNFDGTAATNPTIFTVASGVETAVAGTSVVGNVITVAAGLVDGTTYAVYNNASVQRTTFIWHTADGNVTVRTHTIAFSQDVDYKQSAEDVYQTAGWTFGLYVDPDPIYNPSYAGAGTIDANARWTWTYLAGIGTGSVTSGDGTNNSNYVEFTNPTVGSYDVTVVEKNTAVGCFDNGQSIHVNVIADPKAVITTANPATACGNQAAASVTIQFTEAVPVALAGYAFAVTESVDNLSDLGATPTVTNVSSSANFVDFPMTGKLKTPTLLNASSPYAYSFNTSALNVMNNKITRYTYTLVKATDANASASEGLISAINQKSQYIALKTPGAYVVTSSYDGKATYVAIVTPMPQTGPVYYIPNTYAY